MKIIKLELTRKKFIKTDAWLYTVIILYIYISSSSPNYCLTKVGSYITCGYATNRTVYSPIYILRTFVCTFIQKKHSSNVSAFCWHHRLTSYSLIGDFTEFTNFFFNLIHAVVKFNHLQVKLQLWPLWKLVNKEI